MFSNLFKRKKYNYLFFEDAKLIKKSFSDEELEAFSQQELKEKYSDLALVFSNFQKKLNDQKEDNFNELNKKILLVLKAEAESFSNSLKEALNNTSIKYDFYLERLRSFRSLIKSYVSLITNQSWQSPDYGFSLSKQHGNEQNNILPFFNDYQRYGVNTYNIETSINKKYAEIGEVKPKILLFNSGMGAFSALVQALPDFSHEKKLAGKNLYFEIISVLKHQKNISFIQEESISEIIEFIKTNNPKFLFFDPIANSRKLPLFDFKSLFEFYKKNIPTKTTFIIIDTSLCMDLFQPASFFDTLPENINLILFRSLQKTDQFGLDLAQSGIIVYYGRESTMLDNHRQYGFNPTEEATFTYELLSSDINEKLYLKNCRNSLIIADYLNSLSKNKIIDKVYHPLIANKNIKKYYQTPLLFFSLKPFFTVEDLNYLIEELIKEAKNNKVELICGSSFGFHISRLILISFQDSNEVYIRFSPSSQTLYEIQALINIFDKVFSHFVKKLKEKYEKEQIYGFKTKFDTYINFINKISIEKNLEESSLTYLTILIDNLFNSIKKFKFYSESKSFYEVKSNEILTLCLGILNSKDLNISDEIKKQFIKLFDNLLK